MPRIADALATIGLSSEETGIFLALTRLGASPVSSIEREAGVPRARAIAVLEELRDKGLTLETVDGGVRQYAAVAPDRLHGLLTGKLEDLHAVESQFASICDALEEVRRGVPRTQVRFAEGAEGIRSVYAEIRRELTSLPDGADLLTIFSPGQVERVLPGWLDRGEYIEVPARITKRGIVCESHVFRRYLEKVACSAGSHTYRVWPGSRGEFPVDAIAWGDKVAFVDLAGYPSGTVIASPAIAAMFRMWFEAIWGALGPLTAANVGPCVTPRHHAPIGSKSALGTTHIHVDGARDRATLDSILDHLGADGGLASVVHETTGAIAGPQRARARETYASHTPRVGGGEAFSFFSTTMLPTREDAVRAAALLRTRLRGVPGIVIELERVVGKLDWDGRWGEVPMEEVPALTASEVGGPALPSLPIEIHHGFNIPRRPCDTLPVSLSAILAETTRLGIVVGGWFVFEEEDAWAYRSNAFTDADGVRALCERENRVLRQYLRSRGRDVPVRTIAERVLNIWQPG